MTNLISHKIWVTEKFCNFHTVTAFIIILPFCFKWVLKILSWFHDFFFKMLCTVWKLRRFTITPFLAKFCKSNVSTQWITKKLATLIFLISRVLLRPVTSSSGIPVRLGRGHMIRKVRMISFTKWWSDLIPTFVPENLGNLLPPRNLALWTKRRPLRNHFSSKFCYIWDITFC